jgi:hypothetical protein
MYGVWGREGHIHGFGGKTNLVDPGVDERIILKRIFRKLDVGVWTGLSWLRIETGGGYL